MADAPIAWNGSQAEFFELCEAIAHSCTCVVTASRLDHRPCAAHRMLAQDQRALNGLLFARRIAERLRREEWLVGGPPGTQGVTTAELGRRPAPSKPVDQGE